MERSHLGTAAAACPDRLLAAHDATGQDPVFAGAGDPGHGHIFALFVVVLSGDGVAELQVVHASIGAGVQVFDVITVDAQHRPLGIPAEQHQMVVAVTL